jgi:site-specific DNA-methyltransferase (adenine-specific)
MKENSMSEKQRAGMNRTLSISAEEISSYKRKLLSLNQAVAVDEIINKTIQADIFSALPFLPGQFVDLLIIDPPYNLNRDFGTVKFRKGSFSAYQTWFESWFVPLLKILKPTASVYICSDWQTSSIISPILFEHLIVRNRITWEREKGRGAKSNWKNSSEDIWFSTVGDNYCFNVEAVKLKRRVIAPYREDGKPKDWEEADDGNFRLTHPSNLWTDISVPFWSMPENTDHPTQKPEKLVAKLILASSKENHVIFDPFLGSGTSSVVAKKLKRSYVGIEIDETYACLAEKRLALAEENTAIQGYHDGVFWERNTNSQQKVTKPKTKMRSMFEPEGNK